MKVTTSINGQIYTFNSKKDLNNLKRWEEAHLIELEFNGEKQTIWVEKEEDYNYILKVIEDYLNIHI